MWTNAEIEAHEAYLVEMFDDAITHGLYVDEVDEIYQTPYVDYLESLERTTGIQEILDDWYSLQDLKALRSRGA